MTEELLPIQNEDVNVSLAVRLAKQKDNTLADIARQCGVSRERVRQVLKTEGIKLQHRAGPKFKDKVMQLRKKIQQMEDEEGLSGREIAEILDVPYAQVRHALYYKGRK